ncbi:hypothetical protein JD969_12340 [Planctomycetota bacterium]|nr:hypothetical protein JD969_12340 [Planctomycetota bacterium]
MDKDRLVQIIAVLFAVSALFGATMLVPTINKQRRDLELSFDLQRGDDLPPKYALASAMLGSFRGLAVDALWYRIEDLKNKEKFHEANTLATWITVLQPRFPQVWAFQAWNLAYNVSVKTNTPSERYDWVSKGVRLLREEGIPKNRQSVRLYRELSWIFFHKMGKYADDMHWYYKRKLAEEWNELLGAPMEGATTQQVLDQFRPVAEAMDRYFVLPRLTRVARNELDRVMEAVPEFKADLEPVRDLTSVRVTDTIAALEEQYTKTMPDEVAELAKLKELIAEQGNRDKLNKLALLYKDHPETQAIFEKLYAAGEQLDESTLRKFGRMFVAFRYNDATRLVEDVNKNSSDEGLKAIVNMMYKYDEATGIGLRYTLAYLRAKVLWENYKMDPGVMYELMEIFGPLDWRHPAAHGVYWAFLGVRVAGELKDTSRIDILNTDRGIKHGLQELMYLGRVSYDPFLARIDLLPDPRFIPKYELSLDHSLKRMYGADFQTKEGVIKEFQNGHENFLVKAVVYTSLYGDEKQAAKYYAKIKRLYGDKPHNARSGRFNMPLEDFVATELKQDMDMQSQVIQFMDAMIGRAMTQGLANGDTRIFAKFMKITKSSFEEYSREKLTDPKAEQARQKLGTFEQYFSNNYAKYMRSPGLDVLLKAKIYANTPTVWQEFAYPKFKLALSKQCAAQGFPFDRVFPMPEELRKKELAAPSDKEGEIKTQKSIEQN